jgi:5-methyltetrahydrofolate--homocysteine methyltransferase
MLQKIITDQSMNLKGIIGLFPANRSPDGEDIYIYENDTDRTTPKATFCMLRQQAEKETDDVPYMSQADFIAPIGYKDYMGMFAVSCFGCDDLVKYYENENDDYSKIMVQALADRFVEAFAEYVHREIRLKIWGYAPDEQLNETDLLKIKYHGIRPAPGYPSQPDHTEKGTMWSLLQVQDLVQITLTESYSMNPASSVSALVFAHEQSEYFAVGQIGKDQITDYAQRKNIDMDLCERWLSPILNYERN